MADFLKSLKERKPTLGIAPIWYITHDMQNVDFDKWTLTASHDDIPLPAQRLAVIYEPDESSCGQPITVNNTQMSMEDIEEMIEIMISKNVPIDSLVFALKHKLKTAYEEHGHLVNRRIFTPETDSGNPSRQDTPIELIDTTTTNTDEDAYEEEEAQAENDEPMM